MISRGLFGKKFLDIQVRNNEIGPLDGRNLEEPVISSLPASGGGGFPWANVESGTAASNRHSKTARFILFHLPVKRRRSPGIPRNGSVFRCSRRSPP